MFILALYNLYFVLSFLISFLHKLIQWLLGCVYLNNYFIIYVREHTSRGASSSLNTITNVLLLLRLIIDAVIITLHQSTQVLSGIIDLGLVVQVDISHT